MLFAYAKKFDIYSTPARTVFYAIAHTQDKQIFTARAYMIYI